MNWKRRYSFRLTEKDKEVGLFLSQLEFVSESDAIRHMLTYAYRQMTAEGGAQQHLEEIREDIWQIKHMQERLNSDMKNTIHHVATEQITDDGQQIEGHELNDRLTADTAQAMLDTFGINFD